MLKVYDKKTDQFLGSFTSLFKIAEQMDIDDVYWEEEEA